MGMRKKVGSAARTFDERIGDPRREFYLFSWLKVYSLYSSSGRKTQVNPRKVRAVNGLLKLLMRCWRQNDASASHWHRLPPYFGGSRGSPFRLSLSKPDAPSIKSCRLHDNRVGPSTMPLTLSWLCAPDFHLLL